MVEMEPEQFFLQISFDLRR